MFFALCYCQNQLSAVFAFMTIGSYSEMLRKKSAVLSCCQRLGKNLYFEILLFHVKIQNM